MTTTNATIELQLDAQRVVVTAGEPFVVGRNQPNGLSIDDPQISTRHVVIWFDRGWRLRAEGRNGTFLGDQRIDELTITGPVTLTLARPDGPTLVLNPSVPAATPSLPPPGRFDASAAAVHSIEHGLVRIGREPDNDVVLEDLLVSRHHAVLQYDNGTWWLRDLNSANGTYLDGRRITVEPVQPVNIIGIGRRTFRLVNGMLAEYVDTGAVTFEARELYVVVGQRRILDNVSFVLEPNSMLVIVGPSGSGKSTLLKALTATQPASYGQVGYGGRDLYSNYDEIRHRLGFVPQDDILHPQLRVRAALDFAGRLRLPAEVTPEQRAQRVYEVIAELGLLAQADQRISTLSGGQRKRTSTAMELLTRPSLLFLDEPTSGLDINRDREVMNVLRKLADGGRTVVVVSHNVTYLHLADRILVLATGGQLAYYGPPQEALHYFGFSDYADMYAALEQPRNDWRERFEQTPLAREAATKLRAPIVGKSATPANLGSTRNQSAQSQFATLCRRYLAVISADRAFVVLALLMPIVLALFAHAVPGSQGLSALRTVEDRLNHRTSHTPGQLLLVLIMGGCLMGTASSVREVVKERAIYAREQAIGLSWSAYLASKLVVLSVIAGIQAIAVTVLGTIGIPAPDDGTFTSSGTFEIVLAVLLVTVSSMCIGLALSAFVSNADRVMPLLVLVIMAQLLMSGGLFAVNGAPVLAQLSWLVPARWAFAAAAGTTNLNSITAPPHDGLWAHSGGVVFGDLFALVALSVLYAAVAAVLIKRVGRLRAPAH